MSSRSARETELIGVRCAQALPSLSAQPAVAYLRGDLGAGKTTFARGFLEGRGFTQAVRSPTYTILECYDAPGLQVVHLDLYRIEAPSELEPLGLRDLLEPRHVFLIEWPERGGSGLPPPDLSVALEADALQHRLAITGQSALGCAWLQSLVELCAFSP